MKKIKLAPRRCDILEKILDFFEKLASVVPLELFAFIGSFFEEVLAPIPSPFIMTLTGSIAEAQGYPFFYLFVVAVIAAAGKTLGAILLYFLADKVEDLVLSRIGRYIGITHTEVEAFGNRFQGSWRDYVTLMIIRSTPIIPSAPISLICGFIALPKRLFVTTTFFGTIIRDFAYLYFGFTGLAAAEEITGGFEGISSIITVVMAVAGAVVVGWIIYKRKFSAEAKAKARLKTKKSAFRKAKKRSAKVEIANIQDFRVWPK